MTIPDPGITVRVDLTNPGQFFACCGLLELADRLWPGAEGWFADGKFSVSCSGTLRELLHRATGVDLEQIDPANDMASPMRLSEPFNLMLDWWTTDQQLKVWAGSMRNVRIARAMQKAVTDVPELDRLLDHAAIVYDPDEPTKKVEPYYFDGRRGRNARSLDIGFAPDGLNMTTVAYPAVEFLCLLGLQRFRPAQTRRRRVFDYSAWSEPLPLIAAPAAASGAILSEKSEVFRFENAFRTDQKKHKSFLPARRIGVSA